MIPRVLLDTARTHEGGKEIRLYKHDKDFYISVDGAELMSSRTHASEEALAKLAMERIQNEKQPQILIGGLGMGFTLRSALDELPPKARVVVAELVPAVVKWNRGLLSRLAGNPLRDRRVGIREVDAAIIINESHTAYDAILLDVDNGPGGLSRIDNDWFYDFSGLKATLRALKPKGVLAIWSAGPDIQFVRRLHKVGFQVDEVRTRAHGGRKSAHHLIWLATKRGPQKPPRKTLKGKR